MFKRFSAVLACLVTAQVSVFGQQALTSQVPPSTSSANVSATPDVPPRAPSPNTLLDGTAVKLRLAENLSSATAKTGQQVSFEVIEEVDLQGVPIILKGAQAIATVTDAATRKSMGRGGKLDVNVDSTRLADGEKVQLRAVRDARGGGHTGAMTGAMVATAIVFFPAAPLFLFVHGKDITIPKGTEITAFVQGDMKLDMAKLSPGSGSGPAAIQAVTATTANVSIESTTPNCDIEVDGEFVGNTPSSVALAPGKHQGLVKKTGFQDWSRSMTFGGGSVRLNAEMVAK